MRSGFTLIEILACLMVSVVLAMTANYIYRDFIPRHQVIADTNAIIGLIRAGRSGAITDGNRFLCDGESGCQKFKKTQVLILGHDQNNDQQLSEKEIIEKYRLNGKNHIVWKRFRGNALVFTKSGNARYQNGSFYICNTVSAKRIVMNWIGHTRVEPASPTACGA